MSAHAGSQRVAASAAASTGMVVELDDRWLVARFAAPQRVVSWAIVGGGMRRSRAVAWLQVDDADLRPPVDPRELLRARLAERALHDAVGLLTSRRVDRYVESVVEHGDVRARAIVTVGLGNALRAGDRPGPSARIGTINALCWVDRPLSSEAMLEAMAIAAEARTLAVREADVASVQSGAPASGTGTDCIVIAAPDARRGARYAGKHTAIGHVVGAAVLAATAQGIADWKRDRELLR